ncbi:hypothetical protein H1R16_09465 [Marnyiella aurantia]|uniref:Uncharacterized protein n=1 Tax=Marnyiella aurantia TaxID=2758037 RepID=A0A7D7QEA7_9FLAO|nr:hypothetical protein [Marnyiella aurantia]MBA5246709.1 hypothetical protein [Marnyiella aurantia]QMS97941.1 hypothetical protein H1R16_09465 [Marnyiella aurantia]
MKTYLAILKSNFDLPDVKKKLIEEGMEFVKFYPKLKMVKIKSDANPTKSCSDIFDYVEKEKDDFSAGNP